MPILSGYISSGSESSYSTKSSSTNKSGDSVDAEIRKHNMLSRIPTRAASCRACSPGLFAPKHQPTSSLRRVPAKTTPTNLAKRAAIRAAAKPPTSAIQSPYKYSPATSFSISRPGTMGPRRPLAYRVNLADYANTSAVKAPTSSATSGYRHT
jgi:hypothetical protein